ncbi:hypothetical protein KCU88_g2636, partial [Aureobasidium melanogenum]
MSRRTIGGGRVLGSGRTLGPPAPPPKSSSPVPARLVSPSASSLSLNTSASEGSTPPSSDTQDIAARISVDNGAPDLATAAAAAGDRLVCPICNEEMVTLLQLNRHLDDAHKEIEEEQQDEVKDWFKQQMVKAKKFQPLAVLNQKLKGLDVFESNHDISRSGTPTPRIASTVDAKDSAPPPTPPKPTQTIIDPDDVITKQHWQKRTGNDDPDRPPSAAQLTDASRTRKRLMDSFSQYDTAARRIRDLPSQSATQLKLQKAIYQNATQFLHLHMLPLKSLPKVLKHATPHGAGSSRPGGSEFSNPRASLAVLNRNRSTHHMRHDSNSNISVASFASSSRVSELEAEEKALRERLIVLEEQKFMVQEMIADANKRRKFDEVAALAGNVEDLSVEIDRVQKQVDNLRNEFEDVYTGLGGGGDTTIPNNINTNNNSRPSNNGLGSGVNSPIRKPSHGATVALTTGVNISGARSGSGENG